MSFRPVKFTIRIVCANSKQRGPINGVPKTPSATRYRTSPEADANLTLRFIMQTRDSISRPVGDRQTVNVLQKALDVLEQLVWEGPMTLGELAEASGVERAAVYRIMNTFIERDYLAQDAETRKFLPGRKLRALAAVIEDGADPIEVTKPYLQALWQEFGETVNFGVLVGPEVHYLKILESAHQLKMSRSMDLRDPAYTTALGKAVLSRLGDDAVRQVLRDVEFVRRTERTVDSLDSLLEELRGVRERGFALDNQENELGAICVATPIDVGADTRYAISISGPLVRVTPDVVDRMGSRLREAAAEIAEQLAI